MLVPHFRYLANWNKQDKRRYPTGHHDPTQGDVGANFFPALGPYSSRQESYIVAELYLHLLLNSPKSYARHLLFSRDPTVISSHMRQIRISGAGVIVLSWYPPRLADENGLPTDEMVLPLLDAAEQHDLKVGGFII